MYFTRGGYICQCSSLGSSHSTNLRLYFGPAVSVNIPPFFSLSFRLSQAQLCPSGLDSVQKVGVVVFFSSICHVDNPGSDRCCYTRDSCTFSADLTHVACFPVVRRGAGRRQITDIFEGSTPDAKRFPNDLMRNLLEEASGGHRGVFHSERTLPRMEGVSLH